MKTLLRLVPYLAVLVPILFIGACSGEKPDVVSLRGLSIVPFEPEQGEEVIIEFWIDHTGGRTYPGIITDACLIVDGKTVRTKRVQIDPDTSTRCFFGITAGDPGFHSVAVSISGDKVHGEYYVSAAGS